MASKKEPWDRPAPKRTRHTRLTSAQKSAAKERAARGGRRYPNLVDNMAVASRTKKTGTKKAGTKKAGTKKAGTKKAGTKKAGTKKAGTKKAGTKKAGTKKAGTKKTGTKKAATAQRRTRAASAASRRTKDPRGGLTAAGRAELRRTQGSRLKPGVKKSQAAMSLEELRRKGSWATRFYGRKQLPPLRDAKGHPTRFALSAHAWGEPVPATVADARRIAAKGARLLASYQRRKKDA